MHAELRAYLNRFQQMRFAFPAERFGLNPYKRYREYVGGYHVQCGSH